MKKTTIPPKRLDSSRFYKMMSLIGKGLLAFGLLLPAGVSAKNAYPCGKAQTFIASFLKANERSSEKLSLRVSAEREFSVKVNVNIPKKDFRKIVGEIEGHPGSSFFFYWKNASVEGKIILYDTREAYDYYTSDLGEVYVKEIDINKVVCMDHPVYTADVAPEQPAPKKINSIMANPPQPQDMQSLPGAPGVIYIDFDGEYVSGSSWNGGTPIDAQPANFTETQMRNAWMASVEDWLPFKVNVTTNRAVYDSYPNNRRIMNIVTTTNWRGSGGVAYVNSFSDNDDEPCWSFNRGDKSCYMTISHEVGHTMGLGHDGTSSAGYYSGHGNWGPIMGAPFTKLIAQWGMNEYAGANNSQDDYAIITKTANGLGYRADDHANTATSSATTLVADLAGKLDATKNNGIIETRADKDVFKFVAGAGPVYFAFTGGPRYPDLDMQVRLLNSGGTEVMKVNPEPALNAVLSTDITTPGTYYIEIDGVGYGNPSNTGYSDYGSRGYFAITGNYTMTTSLEETPVSSGFSVYPNPGDGLFNLSIDGISGKVSVEVYNTIGQRVFVREAESDLLSVIDLTSKPAGLYHVRLITESGILNHSLVKQ